MTTRSRIAARIVFLTAVMVAGGVLAAQNEAYAVVAGTVFRENGLSLAGATVTLVAKDAAKRKPVKSMSDARGEFAFRVSPAPGTYVVRATIKGFQPAEKEASVGGEERVDVTLILTPESK
jgi:hypothetical protein